MLASYTRKIHQKKINSKFEEYAVCSWSVPSTPPTTRPWEMTFLARTLSSFPGNIAQAHVCALVSQLSSGWWRSLEWAATYEVHPLSYSHNVKWAPFDGPLQSLCQTPHESPTTLVPVDPCTSQTFRSMRDYIQI